MQQLAAIFFDFDSTVTSKESFDEVIALAVAESPDRDAIRAHIETITNRGMEGTLPFTQSLQERFAAATLTRAQFQTVGESLTAHITPGFAALFTWLRDQQIAIYIISGGFRDSILPTAALLGVADDHVVCNDCTYDQSGIATGINTTLPTYTDEGKKPVVAHLKAVHQITGTTCMIGDGANDLAAYEAGVTDYFCGYTQHVARSVITSRAPHTAANPTELQRFISTLGAV